MIYFCNKKRIIIEKNKLNNINVNTFILFIDKLIFCNVYSSP